MLKWLVIATLASCAHQDAPPESTALLPVVLQTTPVECGPAALAMTLGYYGHPVRLADVGAAMKLDDSGSSALEIKRVAEANGLGMIGFALSADQVIPVLRRGDIVHWDFNHFVVVEQMTPTTAQLVDPSTGRVVLDRATFTAHYSGVALLFAASPAQLAQRRRTTRLVQ